MFSMPIGNEETVSCILQHRLCPSVNAKNELGKWKTSSSQILLSVHGLLQKK